ncbi:Calmodulin [Plasmodiophora brassicae]
MTPWIARNSTLDALHARSEFLGDRSRQGLPLFLSRFRRRPVRAGEVLIHQGRLERTFFVMESGQADVVVEQPDGRRVQKRTIRPLDPFGELSTVYAQPRAASVIATQDSVVWEVDEDALRDFLDSNPSLLATFEHRRRVRKALSGVTWFLPDIHDEMAVKQLLDAFRSETYSAGQDIVRQGDSAVNGRFYVILDGQCDVLVARNGSPPVGVARLASGDSFGELALMRKECCRNATVRACSADVVVLSIDRQQFQRLARKACHRLWKSFLDHASVEVDHEKFLTIQDLEKALMKDESLTVSASAKVAAELVFDAANRRAQQLMPWVEFVMLVALLRRENAHLQLAFMFTDRDHDGRITRHELEEALQKLTTVTRRLPYSSTEHADAAYEQTASLLDDVFQQRRSLTFEEFAALLQSDPRMAHVAKRKRPRLSADTPLSGTLSSVWKAAVSEVRQAPESWFVSAIEVGFESEFPGALAPAGYDKARRPWLYLLSGAIAGAVSRTLVSPLIRLKIMMQTGTDPPKGVVSGLRLMYARDGFRGLFQGNGTNVVRIAPTTALQFFFFETIKDSVKRYGDGRDMTTCERLIGGGCAGMAASAITYPLDFIRARLTVQTAGNRQYNGIVHGVRQVIQTEGAPALFRGLWPTLVGVFPYIGIDFAVYETLKPLMPRKTSPDGVDGGTTALGLLFAGGVAGLISQTVAFPLELIRRRLQVQGFTECAYGYNGGIWDAVKKTVAKDGPLGLYRGMSANVLKAVPSISVSFLVYENCKSRFGIV